MKKAIYEVVLLGGYGAKIEPVAATLMGWVSFRLICAEARGADLRIAAVGGVSGSRY